MTFACELVLHWIVALKLSLLLVLVLVLVNYLRGVD